MSNPWLRLPKERPFVLSEDAEVVEQFNQNATDSTRLQVGVLPEPFVGSPDAPVVLLALNPGFSEDDPRTHARAEFAELSRANLEHRAGGYPFYLLTPSVESPGRDWWKRRLRALIEATSTQIVAQRVLCVEYMGYHSKKFAHSKVQLPSQKYGFDLVRAALARGALVVLMRSRALWFKAVPELERYQRLYSLKNVRNPAVSPGNCPDGFGPVLAALKEP